MTRSPRFWWWEADGAQFWFPRAGCQGGRGQAVRNRPEPRAPFISPFRIPPSGFPRSAIPARASSATQWGHDGIRHPGENVAQRQMKGWMPAFAGMTDEILAPHKETRTSWLRAVV